MTTTIGYIGMGIMGSAMAANLVRAGFDVTVWNRTAARCAPLVKLGARRGASPAELARNCDIVCINVTDTSDVRQVLFAADGVQRGARRELIVIDHSTISPSATADFAKRLAGLGTKLLDAPVSGGDVGARNATLSIMVGGDAKAYARALPVLNAVGKRILHVGPSGAGQTCKLCNNIAVLVTLAGVCEAMSLAKKSRLDLAKMLEVVGSGAGGSWQLSNLGPKIAGRDHAPGFMIDLALKDLRIALKLAGELKLPLAATRLARKYLRHVASAGGGRLGTQAMVRALESAGRFHF